MIVPKGQFWKEKTYNAIVYFQANTLNYDTQKLFRLLLRLDFDHYASSGMSVTGLLYRVGVDGPVPDRELPLVSGDAIFDSQWFSERQLRLLSGLAGEFEAHPAKNIWVPEWYQAAQGDHENGLIPYRLALTFGLEPISQECADAVFEEYLEILSLFGDP